MQTKMNRNVILGMRWMYVTRTTCIYRYRLKSESRIQCCSNTMVSHFDEHGLCSTKCMNSLLMHQKVRLETQTESYCRLPNGYCFDRQEVPLLIHIHEEQGGPPWRTPPSTNLNAPCIILRNPNLASSGAGWLIHARRGNGKEQIRNKGHMVMHIKKWVELVKTSISKDGIYVTLNMNTFCMHIFMIHRTHLN